MSSLRTKETIDAYHAFQATQAPGVCHLCDTPATESFTFWKIIPDKFPYDRIAKQHDLLVPKRHAVEGELTEEEKKEFFDLKQHYLNTHYEILIETAPHLKSVPSHHHVHLIVIKDE